MVTTVKSATTDRDAKARPTLAGAALLNVIFGDVVDPDTMTDPLALPPNVVAVTVKVDVTPEETALVFTLVEFEDIEVVIGLCVESFDKDE